MWSAGQIPKLLKSFTHQDMLILGQSLKIPEFPFEHLKIQDPDKGFSGI